MSQGSWRPDACSHDQSWLVSHILCEWLLQGSNIHSPQPTHCWSASPLSGQSPEYQEQRAWRPELRSERYWGGAPQDSFYSLSSWVGKINHCVHPGRCTFCLPLLFGKIHYDEASAMTMSTFVSSSCWSFENKLLWGMWHLDTPSHLDIHKAASDIFLIHQLALWHFQEPDARRNTLPRFLTI